MFLTLEKLYSLHIDTIVVLFLLIIHLILNLDFSLHTYRERKMGDPVYTALLLSYLAKGLLAIALAFLEANNSFRWFFVLALGGMAMTDLWLRYILGRE